MAGSKICGAGLRKDQERTSTLNTPENLDVVFVSLPHFILVAKSLPQSSKGLYNFRYHTSQHHTIPERKPWHSSRRRVHTYATCGLEFSMIVSVEGRLQAERDASDWSGVILSENLALTRLADRRTWSTIADGDWCQARSFEQLMLHLQARTSGML